jgi:hypothetical protein
MPRHARGSATHEGDVMVLTRSFVRAKRPCTDGFRWFVRQFGEGGHYQELLDTMVAAGRVGDACWLLEQFGPTDERRVVDAIEADAIVFAGTLEVRGGVEVDGIVRVGRSLHAGGGVRVGGELIVGADLRAGWGVDCAGELRCDGDLRTGWDLHCGGRLYAAGNAFVGLDLEADEGVRCARGLQAGGDIRVASSLRAVQGIVAGGSIRAGMHLEAGWGIKAGAVIGAEGAIRAGESLTAGEAIRAGTGYGVFAGFDVQMEAWESSARVSAAQRPHGLMNGWWAGPAACTEERT